jgi:hypothetical protein
VEEEEQMIDLEGEKYPGYQVAAETLEEIIVVVGSKR